MQEPRIQIPAESKVFASSGQSEKLIECRAARGGITREINRSTERFRSIVLTINSGAITQRNITSNPHNVGRNILH